MKRGTLFTIVLGLPYDYAIDTWSVGCTLFEIFTGKLLFPGRNNNHMLRLMMECRGKFPHRMLRKAELGHHHFDENLLFLSHDKDKITGRVGHCDLISGHHHACQRGYNQRHSRKAERKCWGSR